MKRLIIYYSLMLAIAVSCSINTSSIGTSKADDVVLIFKDTPDQSSTNKITGIITNLSYETISFINSDGYFESYTPEQAGYDTLIIPAYQGFVEIMHLYQAIEYDYYLFPAGDTILFTYSSNCRPYARSLKSDKHTFFYNLPYHLPHSLHSNGFTNKTIINDPYYNKLFSLLSSNVKADANQSIVNKYKRIAIDLDSLKMEDLAYEEEMRKVVDSLQSTGEWGSLYANYYLQRFLNKEPIENVIQSDSLMHYIFYYIVAQNYPKGDNSFERFDNIVSDSMVSPLTRKSILKRLINEILGGNNGKMAVVSDELKNEYLNRYIVATEDTGIVFRQTKPKREKNYTFDLMLEDFNGEQVLLQQVVERYSGKNVYVDLWASWCSPCIAEMPFSNRIQSLYNDKDVEFIFISTDKNRANWKRAISDNSVMGTSNHFRVVEASKSQFLQQINFRTIPRYFLLGRNGEMIDSDAPRPSAITQLTQLINEQIHETPIDKE
ncbi:MAG: TlpA family protein disulfide reductase [Bacteroidales bacterium]|nr:TlpA family protein disulfide reductase [Bacteroidales bacterium]